MPENPAGLGYEEKKIVHFTKKNYSTEICEKCSGYKVEVEKFCPRCIARGKMERLQETEKLYYCLGCCFRCLPGAYNSYRATAMRFVCSCGKALPGSAGEAAITKLI